MGGYESPPAGLRTAVVHDFYGVRGGAEAVSFEIMRAFPGAVLHTSVCDPGLLPPDIDPARVHVAAFDRIPGIRPRYRFLLPVLPRHFEHLDLSGYDLVVSSSIAFAKAVRTRSDALHVCYCHTPNRYAWDLDSYLRDSGLPWVGRNGARVMRPWLQRWDLRVSSRPDAYLANSATVQARIRATYERDSDIVHPFVDVSAFPGGARSRGYLLVVSRLVSYKRVDLAIGAAQALGMPLKVVGTGPAEKLLRQQAGARTEFLGHVSDPEIRELVAGCSLLVVPGLEDFGITVLEAMACGRPVVAFDGGGASETVLPGVTGLLFARQDVESVTAAAHAALGQEWDPAAIRAHARRFDVTEFRRRLLDQVAAAWNRKGLGSWTALSPG